MTVIASFGLFDQSFESIEALLIFWDRQTREGEGRCYVYTFRDPLGSVFYVGKGAGVRAHDTEGHRHGRLGYYVSEFLHQQYTVEILRDGLSNDDAELLEHLLIRNLGEQLVNWEGNLGRPTTAVPPLANVRGRTDGIRARARVAASGQRFDEAIAMCRDCLTHISEWQRDEREAEIDQLRELAKTSLAARVDLRRIEEVAHVATAPVPACEALSDLTRYLCESGRAEEASLEVAAFAQRYPHGSFKDYEFFDHRYGRTIKVVVTKREQATLSRIERALRKVRNEK